MSKLLTGSICLSDIPREMMKKVMCRDGVERIYLNISVVERKEPQTFSNGDRSRTYTHFISCAPKKEERKEGVKYILGDLETLQFAPISPTPEDITNAPIANDSDLPF